MVSIQDLFHLGIQQPAKQSQLSHKAHDVLLLIQRKELFRCSNIKANLLYTMLPIVDDINAHIRTCPIPSVKSSTTQTSGSYTILRVGVIPSLISFSVLSPGRGDGMGHKHLLFPKGKVDKTRFFFLCFVDASERSRILLVLLSHLQEASEL